MTVSLLLLTKVRIRQRTLRQARRITLTTRHRMTRTVHLATIRRILIRRVHIMTILIAPTTAHCTAGMNRHTEARIIIRITNKQEAYAKHSKRAQAENRNKGRP